MLLPVTSGVGGIVRSPGMLVFVCVCTVLSRGLCVLCNVFADVSVPGQVGHGICTHMVRSLFAVRERVRCN